MPDWISLLGELRTHAQTSPHPTEKIAAQILYRSDAFDPAQTNARPVAIEALGIPHGIKIADRSLYVHAETLAILRAARSTRGATLLVTDPFCPNCAKQIGLAGIKRVVVEGNGFGKPYYLRNDAAFQTLSLAILAHHGVQVFVSMPTGLETRVSVNAIENNVEFLPDIATLPVTGGWFCKDVSMQGFRYKGQGFTEKYDARVEAMTAALMSAAARGVHPDSSRAVRMNGWPDTPRPFIDALAENITAYEMPAGERPVWANKLATIGVIINTQ